MRLSNSAVHLPLFAPTHTAAQEHTASIESGRLDTLTKVNVSLCSFTDGGSALADTKKPFMWNGRNIATMILAFAVRADPQGRVVYAKLLTHATCHNYVQLLHGQ